MLVAVCFNDFRTGIRLVAEHSSAGCFLKRIQYLFGEAVRISGQGRRGINTGYLPVPDGSIFAHGSFRHTCHPARYIRYLTFYRCAFYLKKSQFFHVWHRKIRTFRYCSQGIHTVVSKLFRIRHLSDSKAVQYD